MTEWVHTHTVVVNNRRREVMAFDGNGNVVIELAGPLPAAGVALYTREEWEACDAPYVGAFTNEDGELRFTVGDLSNVCDLHVQCADVVIVAGRAVSWAAVVEHMNDEIRERIHADFDGTPQQFADAYAAAHAAQFGEPFAVP